MVNPSALNLFPEFEKTTGEQSVTRGLLKTGMFATISLGVIIYFATFMDDSKLVSKSLKNPGPSDYASLVRDGRQPVCQCTQTSMPIGNAAILKLKLAGWCDRDYNKTTFLADYRQRCAADPSQTGCDPNTSDKILSSGRGAAEVVDKFCNYYWGILNARIATWNASEVNSNFAMSTAELRSTTLSMAKAFRSQVAEVAASAFQLISIYEYMARPLTGFGYDPQPVMLTPTRAGSTMVYGWDINRWNVEELGESSDRYLAPDPYTSSSRLFYVPVRKGAANFWDGGTRNWAGGRCERDYDTPVSVECSGFDFYLRNQLNNPAYVVSLPVAMFNLTGVMYDVTRTGLIDAVDVEVSHSTYFETCRPSECTYTLVETPTAQQVISRTLSVAGGVIATLRTPIALLVDLLMWPCLMKLAARVRARRTGQPADEKDRVWISFIMPAGKSEAGEQKP